MTTAAKPATGITTWSIDPAHSNVEFQVKHLMISTVKGRFGDVKGTVRYNDADPSKSDVEIEVGIGSIDTRAEQRDAHLRSPDFFDAERFPTMRFKSKRIEGSIEGEFKLIGDLTIRDVTREVALSAEFHGRDAAAPPARGSGELRARSPCLASGSRRGIAELIDRSYQVSGIRVK